MCALDNLRVQTGDAAFAAGIAPETLLKWLDRRQIHLGPADKSSEGSGDVRLISLRRVHQIAIAATIARLGLPVRTAAAIAKRFTDEGSPGREAGRLHPTGATFLVQDSAGEARVLNERPSSPAALVVEVAPITTATNARLRARGIPIQ